MDTIINRQKQMEKNPERITNRQIQIANLVRLYNEVTWVHEINNGEHGEINKNVYYSTNVPGTENGYPEIKMVSNYMNKIWRKALCNTFVVKNFSFNPNIKFKKKNPKVKIFCKTV